MLTVYTDDYMARRRSLRIGCLVINVEGILTLRLSFRMVGLIVRSLECLGRWIPAWETRFHDIRYFEVVRMLEFFGVGEAVVSRKAQNLLPSH